MAIDNEQYRLWVRARWGIELRGGEGFHAMHTLLSSEVEYRQLDAFELGALDERFEPCLLLRHLGQASGNSYALLRLARERVAPGGSVVVETYRWRPRTMSASRSTCSNREGDLPGRRLRVLGLRRGWGSSASPPTPDSRRSR